MYEKEREASPPTHARLGSLFRSRPSQSRSHSPKGVVLNELLHVRTMHSFTRRMKSFNKDRNPDLISPLPQHMRQTCSSLIKRHGYGMAPALVFLSPKKGQPGRRTTSLGAANTFDPQAMTASQQMQTTVRHARGYSADCTLSDHKGFMIEDGIKGGMRWQDGQPTRQTSPDAPQPKSMTRPSEKPNNSKGKEGGKSTTKVEGTGRKPSKSRKESLVQKPGSAQAAFDGSRSKQKQKGRRTRQQSVVPEFRSDSNPIVVLDINDTACVSKNGSGVTRKQGNASQSASTTSRKETDKTGMKNGRKTPVTAKQSTVPKTEASRQRSQGIDSNTTGASKAKRPSQNRPKAASKQNGESNHHDLDPTTKPIELEEENKFDELNEKDNRSTFIKHDDDNNSEKAAAIKYLDTMTTELAVASVEITEEAGEKMKDDSAHQETSFEGDDPFTRSAKKAASNSVAPIEVGEIPSVVHKTGTSYDSDHEFCDAHSISSPLSTIDVDPEDSNEEQYAEEIASIKKRDSTTVINTTNIDIPPETTEAPMRRRWRKAKKPRRSLLTRLQCCRISMRSCFCGTPASPRARVADDDNSFTVTMYD